MRKTVYINEEMAAELKTRTSMLDALPRTILNVLKSHSTSLGSHIVFPPEGEKSFDLQITEERFDEARKRLERYTDIDDFSRNGLVSELKRLIDECKEMEKPFKDRLESLCFNRIVDIFNVPEDTVDFRCAIVEKISSDIDDKEDGKDKLYEFESIDSMESTVKNVYKRRFIDSFICGGSVRLSEFDTKTIGELYEMNPELPRIYRKILAINDYLLFTGAKMGVGEEGVYRSSKCTMKIGNDVYKNYIYAEGEIFPSLLIESVKGFLEMFAVYGLPISKEEAAYVMREADFPEAEPWDYRFGPALWDMIMEAFGNPETEDLPEILTVYFHQSCDTFNKITREMLGKTRRGSRYGRKIVDKAAHDSEYSEFLDKMNKKRTDVSIISDSYFAE